MRTIKNLRKKKTKKLKSLIGFLSANKISNYNRGREKGKKKKISKRIYRTRQKIRIINVFLESAVRVLSLTGNHSPPYHPKMPSNTVLIFGPAVGLLRF